MKRRVLNSLIGLCAVLLTGCAAMKPGIETTTPQDIDSLLATLKMRYDLVDSMSTWMNVEITSRGQSDEVRASLYYEKPDKLRVDARGAFNEPRAVILAVEKSFQIYFVAENELIQGELSDGVVKDIFDVDLRVSDVRSSIFANPFLDGNVDNLQVESYGDEYVIRRPSTHSGCQEEISILARNEAVKSWKVVDEDEKLVQEITFSRYQEIGGILRPLKAAIHRPADGTHISIESINPEINVELAEVIFDLPVPEGVKIYQLSDLKESQTSGSEADPAN
jgi:hypothetical protein